MNENDAYLTSHKKVIIPRTLKADSSNETEATTPATQRQIKESTGKEEAITLVSNLMINTGETEYLVLKPAIKLL